MRQRIIRAKAQKVITCTGMRIIRYIFALIITLATLCSCENARNTQTSPDAPHFADVRCVPLPQDTLTLEEQQFLACGAVLDLCERDGILDEAGIRARHNMVTVTEYEELIWECEQEESFLDVIGGTDAYEHYLEVCGIPHMNPEYQASLQIKN